MDKKNVVRFVSIGGVFTAVTVLLQSAPVFLPAIGMALSPFSTLPIALATGMNIALGISVLVASVLILLMISLQEALILLFTTGLLGVVLGVCIFRKGLVFSIVASAAALTAGILALTYIVAIPSFQELAGRLAFPILSLLYFLFSCLYVSIWSLCFRKFAKRFNKAENVSSE